MRHIWQMPQHHYEKLMGLEFWNQIGWRGYFYSAYYLVSVLSDCFDMKHWWIATYTPNLSITENTASGKVSVLNKILSYRYQDLNNFTTASLWTFPLATTELDNVYFALIRVCRGLKRINPGLIFFLSWNLWQIAGRDCLGSGGLHFTLTLTLFIPTNAHRFPADTEWIRNFQNWITLLLHLHWSTRPNISIICPPALSLLSWLGPLLVGGKIIALCKAQGNWTILQQCKSIYSDSRGGWKNIMAQQTVHRISLEKSKGNTAHKIRATSAIKTVWFSQ